MPDFLHVTPGWIIGYLSFLQGYEGSLIKLTSKQVRWLPPLGRTAVRLNVAETCSSNWDWNLLHWTNCFHIVILIWLPAVLFSRKMASNCLCFVCVFAFSTFQPVGFVTFDSRSGAEAAKNALNVSITLFSFTSVAVWIFPWLKFPVSVLRSVKGNSDWENKT